MMSVLSLHAYTSILQPSYLYGDILIRLLYGRWYMEVVEGLYTSCLDIPYTCMFE